MQTIRFFALFLTALTAVFAGLMLFAGTGEAAARKYAEPEQSAYGPPLRVMVVRSVTGDCEPLCPQWISAEGEITADSPDVFRKALDKLGDRKLPIVISSPGGDVDAALDIGEMIRKRGLDVAVGVTYFNGCDPYQRTCRLPKDQKGVYHGFVAPREGFCVSACPLILAAGTHRFGGPGSFIGVHQISRMVAREQDRYVEEYRIVNGRKKVVGRKMINRKPGTWELSTKLDKRLQNRLNAYVDKMGVERRLLALFGRAPPSSIYQMKDDDLRTTKLITDAASSTDLAEPARCAKMPPAGNCVAAKS